MREAIARTVGEGKGHHLMPLVDATNLVHRGCCWDDAKVTAHHAIIPITKRAPLKPLSADEQFIYSLVAYRYLLKFQLPREQERIDVEVILDPDQGSETFRARSERDRAAGWYAWRQALPGKRDADSEEAP